MKLLGFYEVCDLFLILGWKTVESSLILIGFTVMAATASKYMRNFSKIPISIRAGNSNHRKTVKKTDSPRGDGTGRIRLV